MSGWHCRHVADAFLNGKCEGPRHATCGVRYSPGEYTLTAEGLTLPGIGTVRMEDAAFAFAPKGADVIIYRDSSGWTAEFMKGPGR